MANLFLCEKLLLRIQIPQLRALHLKGVDGDEANLSNEFSNLL